MKSTPRIPGRQDGAILVTSLLLLLILTVLGIAMMKMTNMQERMAGNTRDLNLALQGAEAGLRDAETRIRALTTLPNFVGAAPCLYCQRGVLPVDIDNPTSFNWTGNGTEFGVAGAQEITQLDEDPRFTIEENVYVPDGFNEGQEPPTGRDFFTVTARSTGATGLANTVLQTTFARRF